MLNLTELEPRAIDSPINLADDAIREICGVSRRLPSGPLHDAAEVCRAGVPTVMLFVQSLHGISHNKIEDTREEHLEMSVRALDRLAEGKDDELLRYIRRAELPLFALGNVYLLSRAAAVRGVAEETGVRLAARQP